MSHADAPSLRARTRALLTARGLRPRKARGQHFLVDRAARDRILAVARITPADTVLEVGPGTGLLTEALLAAGATVVAVEVDPALVQLLREGLGRDPRLTLWQADALRVDFAARLGTHPARGAIRVVANIPYYITSPLLLHLLDAAGLFRDLFLTVQREVAERLVAAPGQKAYGALTVACRYRAQASVVLAIPRGAFYPAPAVESRLVRLEIRTPPAGLPPPAALFPVVRAAFQQRRKTLRNALCGAGWRADAVDGALRLAGILGARRGETLSLEEFGALARALPGREPSAASHEPSRGGGAAPTEDER